MRVLISGIGRSATTLLYRQIAKCMIGKFDSIKYRYEPYLWSIEKPTINREPFDMTQISHYGVHVHRSSPLFLVDSHEEHDKFIDDLFAPTSLEKNRNEGFLTKVIRGAGRLESYLKRFPDLKIVACLRNPIDTINSSFGFFSFLGHEFHADDGEKLHQELRAGRNPCIDDHCPSYSPTLLDYSIWWWRSLTEEMLRVASKYPDNFCLFVKEEYSYNPEDVIENLANFLPVIEKEKFEIGLSVKAGPSIRQNYLLAADLKWLYPQLEYYSNHILADRIPSTERITLNNRILERVAETSYRVPIAGDELGKRTPIALRGIIASFKQEGRNSQPADSAQQINLSDSLDRWCLENNRSRKSESKFQPEVFVSELTFGCVITCYNNEETIKDTLLSVLEQSRPFDQIVVVDDASTDGSLETIDRLVTTCRNVKLLKLATNVGVSAARHFGILELNTDYITQLDGDDYFWPSKNFQEAKVVLNNPGAVAFSDILIVDKNNQFRVCTLPYNGRGSELTGQFLVRKNGVPRDMTFARRLYFDVGGYDLRQSLYEDLDFKLRLSMIPKIKWKRSSAPLGTIYNRITPTLSRNEGIRIPRALTAHFFRHVGKTNLMGVSAAEAYHELLQQHPESWTRLIFERLLTCSSLAIGKMSRAILDMQMEVLDDNEYVQAIEALCQSKSFDVISTPWESRYGMGSFEGPHEGFDQQRLCWQVSKSCGFTIQSRSQAKGIRGLLYVPHLPEQHVSVVVEQSGKISQRSFDLTGRVKDENGNHVLQEVDIPMPIGPGETKISCFATSHNGELASRRDLYCLYADWQLYR